MDVLYSQGKQQLTPVKEGSEAHKLFSVCFTSSFTTQVY